MCTFANIYTPLQKKGSVGNPGIAERTRDLFNIATFFNILFQAVRTIQTWIQEES